MSESERYDMTYVRVKLTPNRTTEFTFHGPHDDIGRVQIGRDIDGNISEIRCTGAEWVEMDGRRLTQPPPETSGRSEGALTERVDRRAGK